MTGQNYRLVRRGGVARRPAPVLDPHQRAVVEHEGGPLLVLAGPGTGKTTTIVEAVVHRVERRGIAPERILVLTFSRKAAEELRERITARLQRTTRSPLAFTFHGYAYALLRRAAVLRGEPPPRLLTAPERLLEIRRLLQGELEDGARHWPAEMRELLKTRGFAQELLDFLSRAAERGLDGDALVRLGRERGRPDWEAAGRFFNRYHDRFDVDPVPTIDYPELIRTAAGLLRDEAARRRERDAYDAVLVDEYQDTDPAQELLLQQLAGDGRELIVVGDPDQSIYGFRGADPGAIMRFPERFRTRDGRPAPVVALRECRRFGEALLAASRRVAARLPAAPAPTVAPAGDPGGHRDLVPADGLEPGEVRVLIAGSASQEAAVVADVLRRAHLIDGVPWRRMAVLVRTAVRQVPLLRRALSAAGVPVAVAGDELPLVQEPGARPLITLLRVAVNPAALDIGTAEELLTGPLGGTDVIGVRRLRRALRAAEQEAAAAAAEADGQATLPFTPRSSDELLIAALRDPRELSGVEPHIAAPAERVARLLAIAREGVRRHRPAEDVLWDIWQASGLAERWTAESLAGGTRGAQADRDLDGVVALFDHAARFTDRLPKAGVEVFLDDLLHREIAGDTLAEAAPEGDAVRILTAHRAKGLEWDVVVVAGVQEGIWPDLRLRGSLLGVDELVELTDRSMPEGDRAAAAALTSRLLDEERRLFYVAVTRARRRLVVTAVGGADTEERPSRFLTELLPAGAEPAAVDDRMRWLSLPALVADLRAAVCDPKRPEPVRRAAAAHLARLARAGVPGAAPGEWYALTELSDDRPLTWPDGAVRVSPSAVERFTECALRWLLETAVGTGNGGPNQHVGVVVHAIAALAAEGGDETDLVRRLDDVWDRFDFGGAWFNRKQREAAVGMIERFARWQRERVRELVAVEEPFTARVGPGVLITGRVDRLERDRQGRPVIVDIKTGSGKPKNDEIDRHPQLGVYQLAALLGAFERHGLARSPGGASLLHVGKAAERGAVEQTQRALADDPDPGWAERLVTTVARGMAGSVFTATANDGCRTCAAKIVCPINDQGRQVC
ncbi:DNA helicase [Thermobispora bispora]|uniref:DNA 3'-5' helicase n=1 Tax=Thermobispora bispora (strain ATCC 19993 / DSM 43833 / CBS 139.67 / JCM 10125 / KCTC 9307 / NBRC 14880 / R51) TaxID=469371 RepID=D6Y7G1_THEBD|nr:ATP-dependent DNA helicase [Thermobispora bispora]ADG89672.1 UvrD/REP helicase [Thermobispora bispora DSM 43833]